MVPGQAGIIINTPDVQCRALRCQVADLSAEVANQRATIQRLEEELDAAKRERIDQIDCGARAQRAAAAQSKMIAEVRIIQLSCSPRSRHAHCRTTLASAALV